MSRIAMLGGPESGKTTYVGAVLDGLNTETVRWLKLGTLPTDARFMEQLTAPLQSGSYPTRTAHDLHTPLELPLRVVGEVLPHRELTLRSADYAGEQVNRVFRNREWAERWQQWSTADAVLLFLRQQATVPLTTPRSPGGEAAAWSALKGAPSTPARPAKNAALRAMLSPVPEGESAPTPIANPTDPVQVPTVLALVELLQLLREARGWSPGERPARGTLRIAVLVSAWDALEASWQDQGPGVYLAHHAALLEDFLWSNFHAEDVCRFGLSSTGGDLQSAAYSEQYLSNPGGYVVRTNLLGQQERSLDLAQPLYWALFGDRGLAP